VGGTREVFPPDAEAAVLVPPDDPQAIAGAVRRLVEDPGQRVRIARAARRRAEEAFDVRQTVAGLVGHYRELIQG
jgi:glycosyltransferase involved in cell wall biosynthesis